jgi:hypothetical protein
MGHSQVAGIRVPHSVAECKVRADAGAAARAIDAQLEVYGDGLSDPLAGAAADPRGDGVAPDPVAGEDSKTGRKSSNVGQA